MKLQLVKAALGISKGLHDFLEQLIDKLNRVTVFEQESRRKLELEDQARKDACEGRPIASDDPVYFYAYLDRVRYDHFHADMNT